MKDDLSPDENIHELVAQAQRGQPEAFEKVYRHFLAPLYRYVYFRVGNKTEAEDLTQTAFLKAWSNLGNYSHQPTGFSSWLYTIARNTVIDHWKKRKDVVIENDSPLFEQEAGGNPASDAMRGETKRQVTEAISRLSRDQQEIIILKFIEDRSNREISAVTGKSEEAIRQLQFRAIRALRRHIRENE